MRKIVCRVGPFSFLNVTPATFISRYSNCFDKSGASETVADWIAAVLSSLVETGEIVGAVSAICGAGILGTGTAAGVSTVLGFTVLSCKGRGTELLFAGGGGKTVWSLWRFATCFYYWFSGTESQKCKNAADNKAANAARNKTARKSTKSG